MNENISIKKYRIFDQVIQDINKNFITPDDNVYQMDCESFDDFFCEFRKALDANDPILKSYHKSKHVGSKYDRLMVGTYKEFDMNLLIKLSLHDCNVQILPPDNGTVRIKLEISSMMPENKSKIFKKWIESKDNNENFILPDNFRKWGESVVDKTLNSLDLDIISGKKLLKGSKGKYLLKMKKSGPAFTMEVEKQYSDMKFDVDLVFCLEFEEWPLHFPKIQKDIEIKEWVAVPKTPNHLVNQGFEKWRYSFPDAEKKLLNGNYYHLKSTIKLIKKLRDAQNMSYLPSYFIKTFFLWEIEKHESNYWEKSIGFLFVTMLSKFKDAIEYESLPFYWDKKVNLLDSLKKTQISNCKATLENVLDKIELFCVQGAPNSLKEIILTNEERQTTANPLEQIPESNGLLTYGNAAAISVAAISIGAIVGAFMIFNRNRRND